MNVLWKLRGDFEKNEKIQLAIEQIFREVCDDPASWYCIGNYREELFADIDLTEEEQQTARKILTFDPEITELLNNSEYVRVTFGSGKTEVLYSISVARRLRSLFGNLLLVDKDFEGRKETRREVYKKMKRLGTPVRIEKVR